jgi:hypothetical protein
MVKKFFDILPPELRSFKIKEKEPEKEVKENKNKKFFEKIGIIILCFLGLIILISLKASSEIVIQPFKNPVEWVEEGLKASTGVKDMDIENKIIPAEFFEIEKQTSQKFLATGESFEEKKAQGVIRVHNSHNPPKSMTLVVRTRFLSSEGSKYFRALESIHVPAAKLENKKIIPSFVDVKVEAMEPGEEYNIGASNFSIPGLVGTSYYYTIHGKSDSAMTGGFKERVDVVTAEDIENAKKTLEKTLLNEAQNSLAESLPEDFILLSSAIFSQEVESSCSEKDGAQVSEFTCEGNIKIKYLVFNESFIKEISKNIILSKISESDRPIEESLSIEYIENRVDLDKSEMILDVKILLDTYREIDEQVLKSEISGKTQEEIKDIVFTNFSSIKKIKVKFWPFWIRKTSLNLDKIKIKIDIGG